jgi:hypothetical protein
MIEPTDWLQILVETGSRLVYRLPELIVYLLGLILALWHWKRNRRVAALAMLGCSLLLLGPLVYEFLWVAVLRRPETFGLGARRIFRGWLYVGLASSCLYAAGFFLLLAAAFIWRTPPANLSWETDEQGLPH